MLRFVLPLFALGFLLVGAFCLANDAIIERHKELLIQSPRKGAIFDRVYGHYVDTGRSASLYEDCLTATQGKPNDANAWMLFGLVAERRNRINEAAEAFQTAAELEPENHLPMLYLGELLLNQRRVYDAIVALEQANERLVQNSGSRVDRRTVLQALALAYNRFGDPQKSLEVWNQLAGLFPNDPDILVQVAESMEFDGKLDEALRQYRRLLTITDDNFERVRISLAAIDIMLRLGDDESALNDLNSLLVFLHSDSYLADAVRDRIDRIFDRSRDQNRHIEFYQRRIEREPNDVASLLRLVRIFQRADRSAEAEALLLDTIRVTPSNIPLRLTLIDLLVARRDISGAIEQFQAMDRIAPASADNLIRWGTLVLQNPGATETARRDEAARIWHRITENAPNDPLAAVMVADLFARNRFNEEAEKLYKAAIALRPNEFSYRESLATFYHQQRRKDDVLETLQSSNQAEVGRVLLAFGYIDEAVDILREVVRAGGVSPPVNPTTLLRYLEALLRQDTLESVQAIRELFTNAERQIVEDEQYVLFLQQNVQLLRSVQRVPEAVRIVQSAVETSPTVRSLWHLAVLHQASANYPQAVAAVERAFALSVESSPPLPLREGNFSLPLLRFAAELYEQSGNTSKAIALYQTLVQSDPARSGNHWQQIITLQIQRGELSQALESTRNLLGRGTENAERLRFVADLFLSVNRRTEAIGLLRQALVHEPGNADVLRILAQTLADSEQHEEAIELFWRLYDRLEHFPARLSVIEILASEYNKLGRDEDLLEHLQLLSRHPDRRREAMQSLVRVYIHRGDFDEAQDVLEDLLDMPDDSRGESEFSSLWVLRELVSIAERQDDFATAARYQEILTQRSSDLNEQQHLFFLYDKLGDTERTRKLFFDQVLRQSNMQDRFELIDTMIRQGQFDIVSQVLNFLDMHEPEHWGIMFRQILVAAMQDKPVGDLVRKFRAGGSTGEEASSPHPSPLPEGEGTNRLHPTFIFSAVAPAELNASLILQNQFLSVLFHSGTRPPAVFSEVQTFQDARFLALGLLLREAVNRDIAIRNDNPNVMRNFRNTIEELRDMLPANSENDNVLMERLRLEVWLLDLHSRYRELSRELIGSQIDERFCQRTIWQIVRNVALDGIADWQSALFQILVTECINELVAERFKTVLPSDARLSEKLLQILDNLCFERRTPPIPAEERNRMINTAARLVRISTADHQLSLRQRPVTLSQKTDRLLELWAESIENASPETRAKYQHQFASRYGTLLWILRSQNRETNAEALELSLRKTAQSDPLWFVENIVDLTRLMDENLMLFLTLTGYDPLETRLNWIKNSAADVLPFCTEKRLSRVFSELLFQHLGNLLRPEHTQRYDIFQRFEQRFMFGGTVRQIWNDLHVPTRSVEAQIARQLFGIDPSPPGRLWTLDSDQMARLVELDRSLRQMTDFAFHILDELKIDPSDFAPNLPIPTMHNVSLTRFRSELQGDRPVDRTVIYSLLQNRATADNFSAVDELFFRVILFRRAMDTKTKYLGVKVDDRVVPIRENYTETLGQFIENKRWSTVPSDRVWGNHLSATFGDLLRMDGQIADSPALGSDADLMQIVRHLENELNERALTHAENLALALLCVRLQRFEEAVVMLDSMELTAPADLLVREWIISDLARKRGRPNTPLMWRGGEAADRLLNFRLSERDSMHLAAVLRFFDRDEDAQRILDHLSLTVSDRRLQAELLNRLISEGDAQKENTARIARRILTNPAFLQNSRRLTADVLLMETAIRVLREQNQVEPVVPILENRLRAYRDKTDSRILLARLYLIIDRRDEAKALTLELVQNPTAERERRQMITSLLVQFGLQRELEAMNRILLERNNR